MTFIIQEIDGDRSRECSTRAEAESIASDMEGLGLDVEIVQSQEKPNTDESEATTDGGATIEPQPPEPEDKATYDLPDRGANIQQDPIDFMPGHFVDNIQGTPAINRKGYAVLAAHYDIGVKAEPIVRASETEFEYAEFQATAVTQDGVEYSGFGSAHVDRMDGDDKYLLNELAETRACKRALALATGVGVVSSEEMRGSL